MIRNPVVTSPLEITQPENGTTVNSSSVIVSGIVDNTVTTLSYSLNDEERVETTFTSNSFIFTVLFVEGENTITVEARRANGEMIRETLSIIRSE